VVSSIKYQVSGMDETSFKSDEVLQILEQDIITEAVNKTKSIIQPSSPTTNNQQLTTKLSPHRQAAEEALVKLGVQVPSNEIKVTSDRLQVTRNIKQTQQKPSFLKEGRQVTRHGKEILPRNLNKTQAQSEPISKFDSNHQTIKPPRPSEVSDKGGSNNSASRPRFVVEEVKE